MTVIKNNNIKSGGILIERSASIKNRIVFAVWITVILSLFVDYIYILKGDFKVLSIVSSIISSAFLFLAITIIKAKMQKNVFQVIVLVNCLICILCLTITGSYGSNIQLPFVTAYILFIILEYDMANERGKIDRITFAIALAVSMLITFNSKDKSAFIFFLIAMIVLSVLNKKNHSGAYILKANISGTIGVIFEVLYFHVIGNNYWINRVVENDISNPIIKQQQQARDLIKNSKILDIRIFDGNVVSILPDGYREYFLAFVTETLGLLGCIILLLINLYLIWNILKLTRKSEVVYIKSVSLIYGVLSAFRVFYNLFMCIGIFPATSLTLPFLCYDIGTFCFDFVMVGTILLENKKGNIR